MRRFDALLARTMFISPVSAPRSTEPTENRLLGALPAADLQRWRAHLEPVNLPADASLWHGGDFPGYMYFPTTASISLMRTTRDGDSLEILYIGSEGIVGLQSILGGGAALEGAVVRVGGQGYRVNKGWVQTEFHQSAAVMRLLLRYAHTVMTHTAQAAICNTHHTLEQRLCRCLLSTFDHGQGAPMNLTHEGLSGMLGVRREGVTSAALKLQRTGVIRYARGRVALLDRQALEARSCECYRVVKTVYDKLLPGSSSCMHPLPQPMEMSLATPAQWQASKTLPRPHHLHVEEAAMTR